MKIVHGLSEIIDEYNVFLVDAWGVLHDGVRPFKEVINTLRYFKAFGKNIIIVTNSPSRKKRVEIDLKTRGISQDLYSSIVSSGELAFIAIQKMLTEKSLPRKCFFLGQNKHFPLIEGLDLQVLPIMKKDMFLLNTGPYDSSDSLESYQHLLTTALHHSIKMICVNPDQYALVQGKARICAGAIARLYEEIGGKVLYFGKPFDSMYQYIKNLVPLESKLVAIGDSLETDIQGGIQAGIDTVLVLTGVTRPDSPLLLQPTYYIKQFQW